MDNARCKALKVMGGVVALGAISPVVLSKAVDAKSSPPQEILNEEGQIVH